MGKDIKGLNNFKVWVRFGFWLGTQFRSGMVGTVRVRGQEKLYAYESPHKVRSRRVCVCL